MADTRTLKLGVNIDHVATLRQARGVDYPDLLEAARLCEAAGADGITIHLREDRRHIQDADVYALRESLATRMNLEMANAAEIVGIALDVRPAEVCIVPERREELTTEGGLDVVAHREELAPTVTALSERGISVSLFVDPDPEQLEASAALGVPYVELHTGTFCNARGEEADRELERLLRGARIARGLGITVNAGHGITLGNLGEIMRMPHLDTLNIGHSIVCHAVTVGLENAVRAMIEAMAAYSGGRS
jgi:pyridoxine 5-phosphate synthase